MSEVTAKMLVHEVTGKLLPQYYDPSTGLFHVAESTGGTAHVTSPPLKMEKAIVGDVTYYGEAVPATLTSVAAWRVFKVTGATGQILYAGTGTFDQVWDNRTSLTYA